MEICQSCGGVIGKDCFNPAECAIIAGLQATEILPCPCCDQLQADLTSAQEEIERLKKTLYYECPDKYPDDCQVCKGANCGVRGNENIVDGVVKCDYCHIKQDLKDSKDG